MPTNDEYFIFYSILTLSTLPACGWAVSNCYQSPRSAQARVDSVLFDLDTIYLDIYVCSIFCSNFCQLLAVCLDGESLDAWKTPPRVRTRRHVRLDTTTETTRETQDNCSVPAPPRPAPALLYLAATAVWTMVHPQTCYRHQYHHFALSLSHIR